MTERPILFSAPMVRAILEGRKTQTRRVVKGVPKGFCPWTRYPFIFGPKNLPGDKRKQFEIKCPYGQPGDRLWVRETFKVGAWRADGRVALDYLASPELVHTPWVHPDLPTQHKVIKESTDDCELALENGDERIWEGKKPYEWIAGQSPCRVRPSIYMPRWASRILLEITSVRVERLQEISEEDAKAEGAKHDTGQCYMLKERHVHAFERLWHTIHAADGPNGWSANPWVWVIEFRRVKP